VRADPETPKIKDIGLLADPSGRAPHEALVVKKTGRAVLLDLDRPETARPVHEEPGGLARVTPDDEGGAYVVGHVGRVMHFVRTGDAFRVDVLEQEGTDSGLRGFARGRFPALGGAVAPFAVSASTGTVAHSSPARARGTR
jgi:hypothetical protein